MVNSQISEIKSPQNSHQQSQNCLHCDTPLAKNQQLFCCKGCESAYQIIKNNGFESYYAQRILNPAEKIIKPDIAAELDNLDEFIIFNEKNNYFELKLTIRGLHCGACIWLIESILHKQPNVVSARVNLTTKTLTLRWRGDKILGSSLVQIIQQIGYNVAPFDVEIANSLEKKYNNEILKALAVAGFGAGNIMLFSIGLWYENSLEMGVITRQFLQIFSSIIALPVIIYSGRIFFRSAYHSIKNRNPNMDIPISIAIILASAVSILETSRQSQHVYFDSAVMLVFFLLIGRFFDFKARKKAFDVASEFVRLQASFGKVEIDNKIQILPAKKLQEGMILLVASGDKIACDGVVIDGESEIDNSLITGESRPHIVTKNSQIYGGSINLGAPIKVKITKNSQQGILSQIIELIENNQKNKNFYIRIADRLSKYYTPIVHIIALITFAIWFFYFNSDWEIALMNATAVLIITCPCALALAVPIAQTITISNMVKSGIIVKDGEVLEKINDISLIIFDKTGTVTKGAPKLQKIFLIKGENLVEQNYRDVADEMEIAFNLCKSSSHPLSKAMASSAKKYFKIDNPQEQKGFGVSGCYAGAEILVGNADFCKINLGEAILNKHYQSNEIALSCYFIHQQKKFLLSFSDEIKSDAIEVIKTLKKLNKKIILLSGDVENEVKKIAYQVGIEEYYFSQTPLDKLNFVQNLQQKNIKFMMLGDGLNDAPSLSLADISISFSRGADLSQNVANIVINSTRLLPLITIFNYTKKSFKIMKQNLFLALVYNIIALPFAMSGKIVPLLAAIAMSSSSIIVVANSLRLNSVKK